jgi:hypothetical protein
MISTNDLFAQFGGGREGWWDEEVWLVVLQVLKAHDGHSYTPNSNPALFGELVEALESIGRSDLTPSGSDDERSVFRAAPGPWAFTGVVVFSQKIEVTSLGESVLQNKTTYVECLTEMFVDYRERRNGKNPFAPILRLLSDGSQHTFQSIFEAVQEESGPEMVEWLRSSRLQGFPFEVAPNAKNPTRSVRLLLRLMKASGLLDEDENHWFSVDPATTTQLLRRAENSHGSSDLNSGTGIFPTSELVSCLNEAGWQFTPWQIASFCQALRTKPFVVLAGISGTGKSKLPQLVADMTGSRTITIAVRPDWRDSSDLLGYADLGGKFRPGPLLLAAKNAIDEPDKQYFVILDEMNLARVEHYFAEVLSAIERRFPAENNGFRTPALLSGTLGNSAIDSETGYDWSTVYLPSNLAIIGTVNMDESSFEFSRKVLDRAFVIEFSDVNLALREAPTQLASSVYPLGPKAWSSSALRLVEHPDHKNDLVQSVIQELIVVNEILTKSQLHFGYRLRDEVALFVMNLAADNAMVDDDGSAVDAIDLAFLTKVLPRIQGGGMRVRLALNELDAWSGPPGNPRYPMCNLRVRLLLDRLDAEGFTSFWS